jgi:hypothetical protein
MEHAAGMIADSGIAKGFDVKQDQDYGVGPIDVVWHINVHSGLPDIKCGFVFLRDEEGGSKDTEDGQFSLRKIEEAAMRGLRSGMDKIYLVAQDEEAAKSVSGKIEWLASHGSILRLDAISLGLSPEQQGPSVVAPSQKRVPGGAKIRKQVMREREAKLEKHNRPQGSRRKSDPREALRESRIDRNSRPRGQVPKSRK